MQQVKIPVPAIDEGVTIRAGIRYLLFIPLWSPIGEKLRFWFCCSKVFLIRGEESLNLVQSTSRRVLYNTYLNRYLQDARSLITSRIKTLKYILCILYQVWEALLLMRYPFEQSRRSQSPLNGYTRRIWQAVYMRPHVSPSRYYSRTTIRNFAFA